MRPYPPLGLLYIAAYLDRVKRENKVFDSTFSKKSDQKAFILQQKPSYLCIYTNLVTKLNVLKLIEWVKTNPLLKHTKVILGGPDVTYNWENYLKGGADCLVIGEGEETMVELIEAIENNVDLSQVNGIAWKDKEGNRFKNPSRKHIKDIDQLDLPARHKIDLNKYLDTWKQFHGQSAINISTQRGCPFTCKWCSTAVYGQSYRRRSPHLVAEEVAFLKEEYNPDSLWFVDDVFTINYKWIKQLRNEFESRNLKIPFECITRAERLNDAILSCLRDMGCFRIWIGAESGSQKIIDAMDRKVAIDQVRSMINKSREYGIESGTFIMVGYPGEDEEDINETIYHLKESNPDIFTITLAYPIKGTRLYSEVEPQIISNNDWYSSTDRDIDFERTYSKKYYEYAIRRIVNEVNYHKKIIAGEKFTGDALKYKLKSLVAKGGMMYAKRL